ncbi:MAG: ParB/RepB/Spo0J family partition protein [Clostridia bacterium]|nr:ParB/RepB/Spo0J family partition protein [Clostridia bacterium]
MIPANNIRPFMGHPYKVLDNDEMSALVESIGEHGIMSPLIVRPIEGRPNEYELISGHRRLHAAKFAGLTELPAVIRHVTRDEAVIMLVDSNLHREKLLPSEKAFAYKLKLEALSRQGRRTDLTSSQVVTRLRTDELVAKGTGEGRMTVQRYIRLTNLIPPLLRMVDEERIAFTPAVELSYLTQEEQEMLFTEIGVTFATPLLSQACRMKKLSGEGKLNEESIAAIMAEEKPNQREKVSIPMSSIGKYLPDAEPKRVQEFIIKACAFYKKHLQRIREEER